MLLWIRVLVHIWQPPLQRNLRNDILLLPICSRCWLALLLLHWTGGVGVDGDLYKHMLELECVLVLQHKRLYVNSHSVRPSHRSVEKRSRHRRRPARVDPNLRPCVLVNANVSVHIACTNAGVAILVAAE